MDSIDIGRTVRNKGIRIKRYTFLEVSGICVRTSKNRYIGVKTGMNEIDERETIAHELAHFEDGSEDTVHIIAERRADKIAREFLIPYSKLREAIDDYGDHGIPFLATLFGVKYETMEKRIWEVFNSQTPI